MLKLFRVAVTGGLSSGKSSVCRFFREFGSFVVSADEIVHNLLSPETTVGKEVVELIGPEIIIDGKINRKEIAKKAFNQPTLLTSLEKILHPAVSKEIEKQYEQVKKSEQYPFFTAEIPLLFEGNGKINYDYTIAVVAEHSDCLARFIRNTGYDENEFNKRMARQLSQHEKAIRANEIITNSGNLNDLHDKSREVFDKLLKKFIIT